MCVEKPHSMLRDIVLLACAVAARKYDPTKLNWNNLDFHTPHNNYCARGWSSQMAAFWHLRIDYTLLLFFYSCIANK